MGKSYTGQPFTLGLDPQTTKPLDVRESVDTISDIYLPDTWKVGGNYYVYPSMETRARDTGIIAVYIGQANSATDIADPDKWVLHKPVNTLNPPFTQAEYNAIETKEYRTYYIVDKDGVLQRIYYGSTLIAQRGDTGATSAGFPLVFPIVFG